ncbi:hypothetical protein VCRA2128O305_480006 [Vibrio crassostreae]|nr:hypothetical protein VCRA2112O187_10070001 [Vibrio crassostreae]CAK2175544.1 hypothetical protein VCRA2113O221_510001 [Vibrio crassostreae]CAK2192509.1 hypothetical protein VCRA2118O236_600002 [Vibrio crassostreae]CAK2991698.1 hypothetical protein VCRA2118O238_450006 [Vibrio crassostreae]CAK3015613.1 hypothetical protein VCRA2110O183_640006 [Vibrio crassostreae]
MGRILLNDFPPCNSKLKKSAKFSYQTPTYANLAQGFHL